MSNEREDAVTLRGLVLMVIGLVALIGVGTFAGWLPYA